MQNLDEILILPTAPHGIPLPGMSNPFTALKAFKAFGTFKTLSKARNLSTFSSTFSQLRRCVAAAMGILTLALTYICIEMATQAAVLINGAGATFPYPLYSKWFSVYEKVDPEVQINYQSIGSGGGIRQFTERTIDFGATDLPMTEQQISKTAGQTLHIL